MNLFNIGVDGQYRVAVFAGAPFAGQAWFPGPLNVLLTLVVAMVAGGLWASIAAYLKVRRGISEVISTIMLNAIATGVVQWLLLKVAVKQQGSNTISTQADPRVVAARRPRPHPGRDEQGLHAHPARRRSSASLYWFVINKTRFGFDLRATGRSESAAVASGVKVPRMVVIDDVTSGALAGLIGMPLLFGQDHSYGTTFQAGLGFAGIGIALLGRNHPLGIAAAALLWSFLDVQCNALQIRAGVASEVVFIIQGVILFAVVIAYELIRRADVRLEQQRVARELAATRSDAPSAEGAPA